MTRSTRRTAPPGWPSTFDALLDLIRFGPQIWGMTNFTVLLFHIERTTWKDADQHSQSQAEEGIWSPKLERWVRGSAGVSRATYKRATAELAEGGFITRYRRRHAMHEGDAPTEYAPSWRDIREAIDRVRYAAPAADPQLNLLAAEPAAEAAAEAPNRPLVPEQKTYPRGSHRATPVAHAEPPPVAHAEPHIVSEYYIEGEKQASERVSVEDEPSDPARQVAHSLESCWGQLLPDDPVPGELVAIAERLDLPLYALCRWIEEKATEWKRKRYPVESPRLWVKAAGRDLIPWAKQNHAVIEAGRDLARRTAAAASAPADVVQMPEPNAAAQPDDTGTTWHQVKEQLRTAMQPEPWEHWVRRTYETAASAERIQVAVSDDAALACMTTDFAAAIRAACDQLGITATVEFEIPVKEAPTRRKRRSA